MRHRNNVEGPASDEVRDWLSTKRVGLALSGGGVRGLAHIGILKALSEFGIEPGFVAGTSVGSLVGVAHASGMDWNEILTLAHDVFWPRLLSRSGIEAFCERHFPRTFSSLRMPFAAVATQLPHRDTYAIRCGNLATALSASCALRPFRRAVPREGKKLADGGMSCVLPAEACRNFGVDIVISSDVWEGGALLRFVGFRPDSRIGKSLYPHHYRAALQETDLLIQPVIPLFGYLPTPRAIERMIRAGELAAVASLKEYFFRLETNVRGRRRLGPQVSLAR